MSTTLNDVEIELTFTDSTTRTYKITDVPQENLPTVKERINTINSNLENGQDQEFKQTFVSNTGALVSRITAGRVIMTIEEVIYSA